MSENLKIIDLSPEHWARAAKCAAKMLKEGNYTQTFPPKYWRDPSIRVINWEGDVIARAYDPEGSAA